ncbi:DNA-directed RNA polymerase I subunit RPA49 isoform X2 [Diabrotica undecimpunctata]|uniref:DNA-directed RNA polymerase I subunit RPA49 isoform X2 n=1 Tax=Diabrotica undecimpunctata TaxID=50387 RepID=UPI003B63B0E3
MIEIIMPVINKIITKKKGSRPILIDFDNGKVKKEGILKLEASHYETPMNDQMVAVNSERLLYTGIVEEDDLYNNFILVHNIQKEEIKLYQVDTVTVRARLRQKNVVETSPRKENAVSELHKQFGSKKAKRVTEQRERLTMKIDDAVKEQLEKTVASVKVDNMEQNNVSENDSIYRPKINRDASTPDGVYNLEDLVEAYILDTLAVEAGNIIQAGSADQFGLCPFATSNINKILISASQEEEKIRSITIFLYIQYLIKFMVTPMKLVTKKFVVCDKSVDVNNHILNLFSEMGSHGRTRPLHMKDKALCYTMVLAAIAMDFEVDVELLSKDMKIGIKKAIEVARILAFNAKANNKNVVQLKLPLPAPVNFTPKKGRR